MDLCKEFSLMSKSHDFRPAIFYLRSLNLKDSTMDTEIMNQVMGTHRLPFARSIAIRFAVVLLISHCLLLAMNSGNSAEELRSLRGTIITMVSENEGLPMKFWAKGNVFRGEIVAGNRKIITIQIASESFVFEEGASNGVHSSVERGLASMG